jgi:hypothetical protein
MSFFYVDLNMFEEWCRFSGRQAGLRSEGSHQALQRDLHRAQQEDRAFQGTLQMLHLHSVLRKRDVYPASEFFPSRIPDPIFFHPGSAIRIKEFKYLNPQKWFLSSQKYDPGCFFTHPGTWIQRSKSHRIRIRNTTYTCVFHCNYAYLDVC